MRKRINPFVSAQSELIEKKAPMYVALLLKLSLSLVFTVSVLTKQSKCYFSFKEGARSY